VHINVPISEPLFNFTLDSLPVERVIRRFVPSTDYDCLPQQLLDDFMSAERPLIVFGQLSPRRFHYEGVGNLFSHVIVLHEALAPFNSVSHFEALLSQALLPDFILYVGDAVVSKRLKHFLRRATEAHTWRVQQRGGVEDTFQNLRGIVEGDTEQVLMALDNKMPKRWNTAAIDYRRHWLHLLSEGRKRDEEEALPFGQAAVVRELECLLATSGDRFEVHYANSTAIRLANRYANGHTVWCNRGTNGIDGSLSTAADFSAVVADSGTKVLCVIGDLSFFYDQNALWNQNLGGNLRILLLNNGRGGIFDTLPGLEASPVARTFVAGSHKATAKGICQQNDIRYLCTDGTNDWPSIIARLLADESDRPVLLEVFHGHG
jgi:2-succinyl-5-enolpyruvyl-6-hydroxy-3-cyclohexene-1-carboxylate synthase